MAQLVERDLAKVEAAGSSPVSRSITKERHPEEDVSFFVIEHLKSRRDDLSGAPKVRVTFPIQSRLALDKRDSEMLI